jgi:hypothetical protein
MNMYKALILDITIKLSGGKGQVFPGEIKGFLIWYHIMIFICKQIGKKA